MSDQYRDPYLYPDVPVLRNKLNIQDQVALDAAELELVMARAVEGIPGGDFDLGHLRRIHRHLLQDVYDWAGKVRTVEITKAGQTFQFLRSIPIGMADVHRRIVEAGYLRGLSADRFAERAGELMGDVNYVHPFREGNGRTQLQYLKQLGRRAGHEIDLTRIDRPPGQWIEASIASHRENYGMMTRLIRQAIVDG